MVKKRRIVPVILSGGAGTRLWPLSRELYPKQLLPLLTEHSLLQETLQRVQGERFAAPLVVCSDEHRFVIAEQLRALDVEPQAIVLEPVARNTAPAVAAAAHLLAKEDPDALMLVLPSDHAVRDIEAFHDAVDMAASAAHGDWLVAYGITPTHPETGYGYIRRGAPLETGSGACAVERFVEKPDAATAERYLADGDWLWNSGMFMFPVGLFLSELKRFEPQTYAAVEQAVDESRHDLDFLRLGEAAFGRAVGKSVDYALMEPTERAAVVPASIRWSDVGAWSALWDLGAKDSAGNVVVGDLVARETKDSYLRSDQGLLVTIGLTDAVVVATGDVVLVADRDRAQEVKAVVEELKASGRPEATGHPLVYRPWGSYESIDAGPRHQVKHITVNPGHQLSLQRHDRRSEHWVVVSGVAEVTKADDVQTLTENTSVYIPVGCVHRLRNPGPAPLHLIEVQTGDYLGEDDIIRLDDSYGRP